MLFTLLAILLFLVMFDYLDVESFATSPGTLLQLAAKGPQDCYLTGCPRYGYYHPPLYIPSYRRPYQQVYVYDKIPKKSILKADKYHSYESSGWSIFDEFPFFW